MNSLILALSMLAAEPPRTLLPLAAYTIHDGDTLTRATVAVDFGGWRQTWEGLTIRVAGVDAPEITRARRTVEVTDDELVRGRLARDELKAIMDGRPVFVAPTRASAYGRIEADVFFWFDDRLVSVADWLRDHGHIRTEAEK